MNRELANYLISKPGLSRLMNSLKEKYISLNRYSGSIILKSITKEESISISDLLGKTYKEKDKVSTDEFNCKAIKVMKKDKIVSEESIDYLESHGKIKRCN